MQKQSNIYKFFVGLIIVILVLLTLAPAINFWIYSKTPVQQDTQAQGAVVPQTDIQPTTDVQTNTETTK